MLVHLNGRLVDAEEARVPVSDRGLLFGDGIFESMRAVAGRVFRIDRHLARLERSAALIDLTLPACRAMLATAISDLLRANRHHNARLRLTVTRGPGRAGDYVDAPGPSTIVITSSPFTGLDPRDHDRGVVVVTSKRQAVPVQTIDPAIKSTSRLAMVLARREASREGAFEALLLDAGGHLTEGTASNVFLVDDGVLSTPSVQEGGLPGVTREAVLELARSSGLPVAECRVPGSRLLRAGEVFLTNTSWEVLPVVRVDGRRVGSGRPGPVTRTLLSAYRELIGRETRNE